MSVSLASCLARSSRCAGSPTAAHAAFLPARSLTRLQRGRPLIQTGQVGWAVGSSRSFSWNPFGGSPKAEVVQTPTSKTDASVSETSALPQTGVTQENVSAAAESTPQASSAVDTSAALQPDATSLVDTTVTDSLSDTVVDSLANVVSAVSPVQYGDMAALGLVSWTPAGFFPWLLELTQVSTGLPWWSVIVLTTLGARAALLPLVVRGQRTQGRLMPIQPLLAEMREKANKARLENDKMAMQQAMVQQQNILKKAGVNPLDQIMTSVAQVCVQLGFFIGLRRMCVAPVEQLKYGGFGWITDLTAADPTYITPLLNVALINMQLMVSRRDMLAVGSAAAPHILNGLRVMSFIGVPFMMYFPVGLNIHLITAIGFISAQTLFLRIPAVRRRLSLRPLPPLPDKLPTMMDTVRYIKNWYGVRMTEAQLKDAERQRKMRAAMRSLPRK